MLFKSFTGLELAEFDSICKEIESRYPQYEIKRLSKRKKKDKKSRCRKSFQTDSKRQISHASCILQTVHNTHTLSGFLFDLDQSNVYRDIRHIEPS